MSAKNLQELLDSAGNTVELLRNSQLGAYIYPVVPSEFTNFRREIIAWRETAVLYDQSHHMHNIFISGPDALKLITDTGINSTAKFPVDTAKQFVPVSPEGGVIGDGILFRESEEEFTFVGRAPVANWLLYRGRRATTSTWCSTPVAVAAVRQGGDPQAVAVPDPGPERVAGHREAQRRAARAGPVLPHGLDEHRRGEGPHAAARHGRRARPGDLGAVRVLRQDPRRDPRGRPEFGLEPCGARAYSCNTLESGWIPSPLPAIYTAPELRSYREWLGADSYEATNAIAGSFVSADIKDYYTNPWELGYGVFVKFDHDFIGRDALAAIDPAAQRRKVTLAWNAEDLGAAARLAARARRPATSSSTCRTRTTARPTSTRWRTRPGRSSGCPCSPGTRRTSGPALSLATVDPDVPIGAEVRVIWGEPDGGRKTTVQPHEQVAVRAIVSPGTVLGRGARELPRGLAHPGDERGGRSGVTRPFGIMLGGSSAGDSFRRAAPGVIAGAEGWRRARSSRVRTLSA